MKLKMMISFLSVFLLGFSGMAQAKEMHTEFTSLLSTYVKDGVVNYRSLKNDPRLEHYCKQLAETDPETLTSKEEKLAFWINAYNAYTLKMICEHYPLKSINDLSLGGLYVGTVLQKTVWDKPFVIINKKPMTLNTIEHKIIRPYFKEPRVHFALVCGAKSCPPLRSEAYEGDKLDSQLDDQGRRFLSMPLKNHFDLEGKTASVSTIFSWFARDFGRTKEELLLFLSRFLPEDMASSVKNDPASWKIRYLKYDWGLNE